MILNVYCSKTSLFLVIYANGKVVQSYWKVRITQSKSSLTIYKLNGQSQLSFNNVWTNCKLSFPVDFTSKFVRRFLILRRDFPLWSYLALFTYCFWSAFGYCLNFELIRLTTLIIQTQHCVNSACLSLNIFSNKWYQSGILWYMSIDMIA